MAMLKILKIILTSVIEENVEALKPQSCSLPEIKLRNRGKVGKKNFYTHCTATNFRIHVFNLVRFFIYMSFRHSLILVLVWICKYNCFFRLFFIFHLLKHLIKVGFFLHFISIALTRFDLSRSKHL